jgi:hypothetical protein
MISTLVANLWRTGSSTILVSSLVESSWDTRSTGKNWLNLSRKKLIGVVKNVGVFAYSRVKNLPTILNPVPITFKFTISI